MSEPGNYGQKYFCVKVPQNISVDGEIFLHADYARVDENGTLTFYGQFYPFNEKLELSRPDYENAAGDEVALLTLSRGSWSLYYAASVLDGHAVAVDHWREEICERVR